MSQGFCVEVNSNKHINFIKKKKAIMCFGFLNHVCKIDFSDARLEIHTLCCPPLDVFCVEKPRKTNRSINIFQGFEKIPIFLE